MNSDPDAARAAGAQQRTTGPDTVNVETARILVELAGKVYEEERQRKESLASKVGTFLAATGIAVFFLLSSAIKPPTFSSAFATWVYLIFLVVSLGLLLSAEWYYLQAARSSESEQIDLNDLVTYDHLSMEPSELLSLIASTYDDLVAIDSRVTNAKLQKYEQGQLLFTCGMGVLALGVIIIGVTLIFGNTTTPSQPVATPHATPTVVTSDSVRFT